MTDILNEKHLAWFAICLKEHCRNEVWIFTMYFGANASAVASRRYLFPFILSVPIAASRCMPDAQAKRKKMEKSLLSYLNMQ